MALKDRHSPTEQATNHPDSCIALLGRWSRASLSPLHSQKPRRVVDRDNPNRLFLKAIDETVVSVDDFAEGIVAHIRHDATGVGEQLESIDRCDESLSQEAGVPLGVADHIGFDSGIGLMTPASAHHCRAKDIHKNRARVLAAAYSRTAERFVLGLPRPPTLPTAAWINKPETKEATH
jgi:hypothetical protein